MTLRNIQPKEAAKLIREGAVCIDIRNKDEYAQKHIAQAINVPIDQFGASVLPLQGAKAVIYHCKTGHRTQMNIQKIEANTSCPGYIMEGGLDAWEKANLPVQYDKSQPISLQRQVQIVAGSLILVGVVLGAALTPLFYLLSGVIGAGLLFAGISGTCGLAYLFMKMPWNRINAK